jgi:hypothetical protein
MRNNNEARASRIQTNKQATELRTAGAISFEKGDLPTRNPKEKEKSRAKNNQAKQSRKQNRH